MNEYLFVYTVQLKKEDIPQFKNELIYAYSKKEAYHKFLKNPYWDKWTHAVTNIIELDK